MRWYKIGVTKFARQHQIPFAWQARDCDHIIRSAAEHERIRKYIIENPQKWTDDRFHTRHDGRDTMRTKPEQQGRIKRGRPFEGLPHCITVSWAIQSFLPGQALDDVQVGEPLLLIGLAL
jgi:hypothetical protein